MEAYWLLVLLGWWYLNDLQSDGFLRLFHGLLLLLLLFFFFFFSGALFKCFHDAYIYTSKPFSFIHRFTQHLMKYDSYVATYCVILCFSCTVQYIYLKIVSTIYQQLSRVSKLGDAPLYSNHSVSNKLFPAYDLIHLVLGSTWQWHATAEIEKDMILYSSC